MKKVHYTKYGEPEVLQVIDVPKPKLDGKKQLLVKVLYSSLNAIDWKNRKGGFRHVSGVFKPRTQQGFDIVGIVMNKTTDVTEFGINDKIVGQMGNLTGGALSEYVVISTKQVAKAPSEISEAQLGGLALAGTTAWQAFFKNADLKEGQRVLINGGSSGVGHFAIQIAKAYGAHVTSVSSSKNLRFCKDLGADVTIDYNKQDFTQLNQKFDIIFDVVFNSSYAKVKHLLSENGKYIGTTPTPQMLASMVRSKQATLVTVGPNPIALYDMARLMQEGLLKVNIDRIYNIDQIVEAHRYMQQSRTTGKVIIQVSSN